MSLDSSCQSLANVKDFAMVSQPDETTRWTNTDHSMHSHDFCVVVLSCESKREVG